MPEKTPAAVTSNSLVNVERPAIQQAPPSLHPIVPPANVTVQAAYNNGPTQGPASVSNINNNNDNNNSMKVSPLPPNVVPPLASMMPPLPITKPNSIMNQLPPANPPTLKNMRNATMSPVAMQGQQLGAPSLLVNTATESLSPGALPGSLLGSSAPLLGIATTESLLGHSTTSSLLGNNSTLFTSSASLLGNPAPVLGNTTPGSLLVGSTPGSLLSGSAPGSLLSGNAPGSLLSGLKTMPNKPDNLGTMPTDILGKDLIDGKKDDPIAKKSYQNNINGKDQNQISFGIVDDSLITKSMSGKFLSFFFQSFN